VKIVAVTSGTLRREAFPSVFNGGPPKPDRADDAFEFGLAVLLRGLADLADR
jgi:hypothetical protein